MKPRTYGKNTRSTWNVQGNEDIPSSVFQLEPQYPRRYERKMFTKDGMLLSIRPIKPTDDSLLVKFFNCLSPETIFFRFLSYLRSLPSEWVERFTRIDYDRDVAMVAVMGFEENERILGVCRIVRKTCSTRGEIAVVVGDPWQDKGIGSALLKDCIHIARELGMTSIWALVSVENVVALALAERFGFLQKECPDMGTTELELTLHSDQ